MRPSHNVRSRVCGYWRPIPSEPHNRLLTQAARAVLKPAGLTQKGRSRTWLDDHGWWLGVVEFQPSSWTRGSYLNVGVMWLWHSDRDHVYFALGGRVDEDGFVEWDGDEEAFKAAGSRLAERALGEVNRFRDRLPGLEQAAAVLDAEASRTGGWSLWDAAAAHVLLGDHERAGEQLAMIVAGPDDPPYWHAAQQRATDLRALLAADPLAARAQLGQWIRTYREALRLPSRPGTSAPATSS